MARQNPDGSSDVLREGKLTPCRPGIKPGPSLRQASILPAEPPTRCAHRVCHRRPAKRRVVIRWSSFEILNRFAPFPSRRCSSHPSKYALIGTWRCKAFEKPLELWALWKVSRMVFNQSINQSFLNLWRWEEIHIGRHKGIKEETNSPERVPRTASGAKSSSTRYKTRQQKSTHTLTTTGIHH